MVLSLSTSLLQRGGSNFVRKTVVMLFILHCLLLWIFLAELFNSGLSYSYINTARSALSSILCCNNTSIPFGQLPIVKRFMKGVFETRPSLPRYSSTWDINVAFNYIRQQKPLSQLTLKDLSHRVAFLLCLLSGQRCQTLSKLFIENMSINQSRRLL